MRVVLSCREQGRYNRQARHPIIPSSDHPSQKDVAELMAQETSPEAIVPAQSQSLYRKYRPNSFDPSQYIGQEHVARTLRNAIVMDRVAHAYLFCGPRGTGKTSTARLLAKAVNCEAEDPEQRPCNECPSCLAINSGSVVDIIEIDAASNRGVDDIRDLREKVRYAPTQLRVKFYIIDEAHQLTRDAFNAFLKTLEEPPDHVKFVLATTEAEKLPDTVASRCQRFDFRRFPVESTVQHLRNVADAEKIDAEDEALLLIARHATGSLRDALGLLDQLALYGEQEAEKRVLDAETVRQVLGLSHNERLVGIVNAIADSEAGEGLRLVTEATDAGEDIHQLNRQMIGYLRMLLHVRAGGKPPEADSTAIELSSKFSLERLTALVRIFSDIDAASNKSSYPQLPLELAVVRAIVGEANPTVVAAEAPQYVPAPAPPSQPTSPPPSQPAPREVRESAPPQPASRPAAQAKRQQAPAQSQPEPQPQPSAPASKPAPSSAAGNAMLEHLIANWSHIRRDVKAENSRIAALLSSADPASVTEDKIILAAPYEFHRNKLNEDNVRQVIERVLEQYTHSKHMVVCMAPDEVPASTPSEPPPATSTETSTHSRESSARTSSNGTAQSSSEAADSDDESDQVGSTSEDTDTVIEDDEAARDEVQRIRAAQRIFEAKESSE
jgi:DNA polymerase III subunit gamma/tau